MVSGRAIGVGRRFRLSTRQARLLACRLVTNPVLVATVVGLVLSLSTVGPTWLDPGTPPASPNCDYAVGAGFISTYLYYFVGSIEMVALFATGAGMLQSSPLAIGIPRVSAAAAAKQQPSRRFVPLRAVPCCAVPCRAGAGHASQPLTSPLRRPSDLTPGHAPHHHPTHRR